MTAEQRVQVRVDHTGTLIVVQSRMRWADTAHLNSDEASDKLRAAEAPVTVDTLALAPNWGVHDACIVGSGPWSSISGDRQVGVVDGRVVAAGGGDAEAEQVADAADVAAGGVDFVEDAVFTQCLWPNRGAPTGSGVLPGAGGARCADG